MISEINRKESKENVGTTTRNEENDIFIEDIESTSSSVDANFTLKKVHTVCQGNELNLENRMTENQQNDIQWLPGIMKTLNKYLKNALISLLIVTSLIPLNLPTLYAFLTNSGCENSTLTALTEFSYFVWFSLYTLFPILIKFKLDRLSQ